MQIETRVRAGKQQGRVTLDADWNEESAVR